MKAQIIHNLVSGRFLRDACCGHRRFAYTGRHSLRVVNPVAAVTALSLGTTLLANTTYHVTTQAILNALGDQTYLVSERLPVYSGVAAHALPRI